jgi:OFA family oxalate/formate antiporter-like MFS transporter
MAALGRSPARPVVNRWVIFVFSIIAMMAIANFQYAWTLFTTPLTKSLHTTLAVVQVAFAAFILAETWLVPFEGWLADHLGPRTIVMWAGVLVGLGWIGIGVFHSLTALYVFYTLGGIGAGAVYGTCIGNMLKWFPDRRGLCAGAVAGAYGVGTALTIIPIGQMIKSSGPWHPFLVWGIIQGAIVIFFGNFIVAPAKGWLPAGWTPPSTTGPLHMSLVDMKWTDMVRQPSFWLIYVMMALMAFTGLVATAQLKPIAQFYHVDKVTLAIGINALYLAIILDRVVNGFTRPFWGWVSDHIGRENAMFVAFGLQALTIAAWIGFIRYPVLFIVLSGLAYFSWGEIFSLFPSLVGDLYGRANATTNYGLVYTAKGVASIFAGPVAAAWKGSAGNWAPIFWAMVICSAVDAVLALIVLKPLALRTIAEAQRRAAEMLGRQQPAPTLSHAGGD